MESRAGYRMSCYACHQPRDGRLTPYAAEYLRLHRGFSALEALDLMDPDRDGVVSKTEIQARSNPGDPRSTPEHIGDWLAAAKSAPVPVKILSGIFGTGLACEVIDRRLPSEKTQEAERFLEEKLPDEDLFPTVFVVKRPPVSGGEKRVVGRAGYAYWGDQRLTVFLVALGTDDVLRGVRPVHVPGDQRFAGPDYYRQFEGKTYETLQGVAAPRGSEAENAALLAAVKRSMKLISLVSP